MLCIITAGKTGNSCAAAEAPFLLTFEQWKYKNKNKLRGMHARDRHIIYSTYLKESLQKQPEPIAKLKREPQYTTDDLEIAYKQADINAVFRILNSGDIPVEKINGFGNKSSTFTFGASRPSIKDLFDIQLLLENYTELKSPVKKKVKKVRFAPEACAKDTD